MGTEDLNRYLRGVNYPADAVLHNWLGPLNPNSGIHADMAKS